MEPPAANADVIQWDAYYSSLQMSRRGVWVCPTCTLDQVSELGLAEHRRACDAGRRSVCRRACDELAKPMTKIRRRPVSSISDFLLGSYS
ncbi:MAG: hypothetical protein ABI896_06050 [Actinomycetota bacterium]